MPLTSETDIADAERVSRFIYDSDKIFADGRPKANAFFPMLEASLQRYETSLCHLICEDARVWLLGREARPHQALKGRADFGVAVATTEKLRCLSSPMENFSEHAVLIEWPPEKAAQKAIGVAIAKGCGPVTAPPPDH